MKKIIQSVLSILFIAILFFTNNISFAATPAVESISVSDVLTKDQVEKVKGKYSSVEDLLEATGWTATTVANNVDKNIKRIDVTSLDELAAILTQNPVLPTEKSSSLNAKAASSSGSFNRTATMYSDAFSTITMYATAYYNNDVITSATCSSGISGFTVGISWSQQNANTIRINDKYWTAKVTGTYSYFIGWEGIGTYYSKTLTGDIDLYL